MRIAQISPLYESVPPKYYGGTERVISWLTEELVAQGHDVTLFASGDSVTSAKLIPMRHQSLRFDRNVRDHVVHHIHMAERVFQRADDFDVIHSHIDYIPYSLMRCHPEVPALTTLHGRLDYDDLRPIYGEFTDIPVVSISNAQRLPLPKVRWVETVYHGLPNDLLSFHEKPGDYLAFLGRVSPEKGLHDAIEIALRAGLPLRIAAKVDNVDFEYYRTVIKPLLKNSLLEFIGEIGEDRKSEFLGGARALLFPIDWPEPFGLVMIEAMACGTPVVARRRGSVPEIMQDGVTGFVVETLDEAAAALAKIGAIDRRGCRRFFEQRFTARRMALDYLRLYERFIRSNGAPATLVH